MRSFIIACLLLAACASSGHASPCLIVSLTGTGPGPLAVNGLAGPGTLVRYGDDGNDCGALKMQFDAGRGTNLRLSQLRIDPVQLDAVFFTHMHNDHTEGFPDLIEQRWMFNGEGPKLDVVCSADVTSSIGVTLSCRKFTAHVADAFIQSGEIAQRHSEIAARTAGGPADLLHTITFASRDSGTVGKRSGRDRAFDHSPRPGTGPGQRILPAWRSARAQRTSYLRISSRRLAPSSRVHSRFRGVP